MCVFHLHTNDSYAHKESLCIRKDAKAQKQSNKTVDVLGRIYGLSHLLSPERHNNIQQIMSHVKVFLMVFQ